MTEGARVIHRILTEEEGYDPVGNPEEYYAEIDRRIALEFPHKFGNTTVNETTSKPTQSLLRQRVVQRQVAKSKDSRRQR